MEIKQLKKSTAEVYKLHYDNCDYANFTVEEICKGEGRISVASSYGNWTAYWGSMGCDIKKFISQVDRYYLSKNFGVKDVVDEIATKQGFYDLIKKLRRERQITAEDASEIIFDIKRNIDFNDKNSIALFDCDSYSALRKKAKWFTPHEYIEQKEHPHFVFFFEEMWKPFIEILIKEQGE